MSSMKVAVMGGGNASHTIAADLTLKGLTVNMFADGEIRTRHENRFRD